MSEVSDVAIVRMLMADYVSVDQASRKLSVVGGGATVLAAPAGSDMTSPFGLFVSIAVPSAQYDAQCSVEIVLEDSSGSPVALPSPSAEPELLRIVRSVKLDEPKLPHETGPRNFLRARIQIAITFPTGVAIPAGRGYMWRLKIDEEAREDWTEEFIVVRHDALVGQL